MRFVFAFILVLGLLTIGAQPGHSFKKLKKIKKMLLLAPFVKPFAKPNLHFIVPLNGIKGGKGGMPCPQGPHYPEPCFEPKPGPEPFPCPPGYEQSEPAFPGFQMPTFNLPPLQMPSLPPIQLPNLGNLFSKPQQRPCPPKIQPPQYKPRPIPCPPPMNNRPHYPPPPPPPRPHPPPPVYNRPNYNEYSEPEDYSYQQQQPQKGYNQINQNDYDDYKEYPRRPANDEFQQVINKYTQESWRDQFRGNIGTDGFHQGQQIISQNQEDQEEYSVVQHQQNQNQNSQQNREQTSGKYYNAHKASAPLGNSEWKAIRTSSRAPILSTKSIKAAGEKQSIKAPPAEISQAAKHLPPSPPSPTKGAVILSPVQAVKSKQQQMERLQAHYKHLQEQEKHQQHQQQQSQQASIIPARAETGVHSPVNSNSQQQAQQQQQQPNNNYQSTAGNVEQSTIPY